MISSRPTAGPSSPSRARLPRARGTREQWPAFAVKEQAVRVPADSLLRAPYLPPHIRNRPRRPALLLWREVAIHAGAPRPDVADGVHPRAPAILDAARSRIFCIEPACNPISWRVKARQKPGSPRRGQPYGRASMASLTTHPPTVDTPSLTPRQPLSTKLSGYRHGWLPTAAP